MQDVYTCPECGYETEDSRCRTCPECDYNGDWIQPGEEDLYDSDSDEDEEDECTFNKYDYSSYGCFCARCERHKYPDV
jgi:hypothetical protein